MEQQRWTSLTSHVYHHMKDQIGQLLYRVSLYCVSPNEIRRQEQQTPVLARLELISAGHHHPPVIFLEPLQAPMQK